MKGYQIRVEGNWGHFKKPETNNNPLSHDLITKTALIGLIGAVLGIERKEMKSRFPELSEDMLYGVQLLKPVRKISWGFTSATAVRPTAPGTPKYFEFLKKPSFKVNIAVCHERSCNLIEKFIFAIKNEESIYPPILGWHNCPANLAFISEGNFTKKAHGNFETKGFAVAGKHIPQDISGLFRIGFDRLPTFQNDDFWNLPDKYENIIYPDSPHSLRLEGEYYEYNGNKITEQCWLI